MTLATIWLAILSTAIFGGVLLGTGIGLSCTKRKWRCKKALNEMLTSIGTISVLVAFYAAFVVATTELVVTVTNSFN